LGGIPVKDMKLQTMASACWKLAIPAVVVFSISFHLSASEVFASTSWEITGKVELLDFPAGEIQSILDLGVVPEVPFTLSLTFDEVPDLDPSPTRSSFLFPISDASLEIEQLRLSFDAAAAVTANEIAHSVHNGRASYFVGLPLDDTSLVQFRFAWLVLSDSDLSDLDGVSFLRTPPNLQGLDPFQPTGGLSSTNFTLVGNAEGSAFSMIGSIDSIAIVPEPNIGVLVLAGLAWLSGARRITSK
jgi:hypothetical protein